MPTYSLDSDKFGAGWQLARQTKPENSNTVTQFTQAQDAVEEDGSVSPRPVIGLDHCTVRSASLARKVPQTAATPSGPVHDLVVADWAIPMGLVGWKRRGPAGLLDGMQLSPLIVGLQHPLSAELLEHST